MNVGFLGGAFNPIHLGHIKMVELALEKTEIEKVLILPSGNPPHKRNLQENFDYHRIEMLKLASKDIVRCEIELFEIENREKITYTVKVLMELKKKYFNDTFYFIMGGDSFMQLESWYKYKELLKNYYCVVFSREGSFYEDLVTRKKYYESEYDTKGIRLIDAQVPRVSSSDIRESVIKKMSLKNKVPDLVERYIYDNNIYKL
jgi:nicotinate-nucleotide adenylyltransferase